MAIEFAAAAMVGVSQIVEIVKSIDRRVRNDDKQSTPINLNLESEFDQVEN